MNIQKAMAFDIFKPHDGDCSNDGISSVYNEVIIPCEYGIYSIDMDNPPANLCKVVKRELFGKTYVHIEPVASPDAGCVGWMYGGTIIDSSDARFRELTGTDYPVHLHDRQETTAQNEMLSR